MKELITVNMVRTAEKARLVPVTYREIADSLNAQTAPEIDELVSALAKIGAVNEYVSHDEAFEFINEITTTLVNKWKGEDNG